MHTESITIYQLQSIQLYQSTKNIRLDTININQKKMLEMHGLVKKDAKSTEEKYEKVSKQQ